MGEIFMPKMGDAMTEGKVVQWYKKPGDAVKKGEPVLEIETDKVNLDLEAEEDGYLGPIEVEAGSTADVGATLSSIVDEPGAAPAKKKESKKKDEPKAAKSDAPADDEEAASEEKQGRGTRDEGRGKDEATSGERGAASEQPDAGRGATDGRVKASPLARKIAKERGIDLGSLKGSGPRGRVVAADVEQAPTSAPSGKSAPSRGPAAPPPSGSQLPQWQDLQDRDLPLSGMRKTIARRLGESIGPIPHFFLTVEVDVTQLLSLREQLNEISGVKTSVNDFIVRGTALALHHHPNVNSSWNGESIRQHGSVHVGIAVATDEGLLTPVVRDADAKSIPEIAGEVRDLATRARNRKLMPDEYQGATFTISNLGMYGIEEFTAIINPPNAAILAVGTAMQKPVVHDGAIVIRDRMKMTMSCDHRVIDGAAGADFLRTLKRYLEEPLRLIV